MSDEATALTLERLGGLYYSTNGENRPGLTLLVRLEERRFEALGRPPRIVVTVESGSDTA